MIRLKLVVAVLLATALATVPSVASAAAPQEAPQPEVDPWTAFMVESTADARPLAVDQGVVLPSIDPAAYLGRWFELGRTPNFFQDNQPSFFGETFSRCLDTEVTYTRSLFDWVGLRNSCTRVGQTTGFTYEEALDGIAVPVAGTNTSQLLIGFGPLPFSLLPIVFGFGGDYWIYAVGPVVDGQYQWALVSGPNPSSDPFFILTRQRQVPDPVRAEILTVARSKGLPVDRLVFNRE